MLESEHRIALVRARWHSNVVDAFVSGFLQEWSELDGGSVDVYDVPGALEIPLHARAILERGGYAAIVGCAFLVDGGIYRHEFVSQTVVDALMQVQLTHGTPVLSGVLTPHRFHGSPAEVEFFEEHFERKGTEAALSVHELLRERRRFESHNKGSS